MLKAINNNNVVGIHASEKNELNKQKYYPINPSTIVRQTALSLGFPILVRLHSFENDWGFEDIAYLPKSQLLGTFVPGWLLIAKAKEQRDKLLDNDHVMEALENGTVQLSDFYVIVCGVTINLDADYLG